MTAAFTFIKKRKHFLRMLFSFLCILFVCLLFSIIVLNSSNKAIEHEKSGNLDFALACLKKSTELMFQSSTHCYTKRDYRRLVEFLIEHGKYEESEIEEKRINDFFNTRKSLSLGSYKRTLDACKELNTDLVEMSCHQNTCGECSKYQGRVFSLSGEDKRFPKVPAAFYKTGGIHEGCRHQFFPFIFGLSGCAYTDDPIGFSNRPFIDERSEEEKIEYEKFKAKLERDIEDDKSFLSDKRNYYKLLERLPNIAPKSFSAYRRMKNMQSKKYIELAEIAKKYGLFINNNEEGNS